MRKLLYISLTFLLVTMVMGCGRSVDKRLVLADSLMWTAPDSSLAILEAIDRDSLQGDENLAYHALLLTQAQFRCNIPLTSDTLISKAVDYYSDNHNREHYTRALLYKGGAYEDMGNPVEAIKWYKQAEDNADITDYRNLAQINFRMGKLYYVNYASNNLDLEKFKKALKYYKILKDERMIMISLSHIGNIYRASNVTEAIKYLNEAKKIALEINDTASYYSQLNELSMAYFLDSQYFEAKDAAMECINNTHPSNAMLFNAVNAYAALIMADSARFYLNKIDRTNFTAHDSMMCAFALGRIYAAEGNKVESLKQESLYNNISEDIAKSSSRDEIFKAEDDQNIENSYTKAGIMSRQKVIIIWGTVAAGLLLLAFLLYEFVAFRKRKSLIDEIRKENSDKYEELRNNLLDFDSHFSETMNEKLKNLEELMAGAYYPQQDARSMKIAHKMTPIDDSDEKFWDGLFSYLNFKYDGVMDRVASDYPQLSNADMNFMALMCCGFSDAAIAVCRNYRNVASVRSRKNKIKDKMGIEETLSSFIKSKIE